MEIPPKFLLLLCFLVTIFASANCASRKLHEHELDSAILSTIMKRNTRLDSERHHSHRQNKSIDALIAALSAGVGNTLDAPTSERPDVMDTMEGTPAPLPSEKQDIIIRQLWGGTCKLDDWIRCNNITSWGGDYFFKEKLEHFEMECTTFKSVSSGLNCTRFHLHANKIE